jgi:hypothetical protein
MVFQRISVVRGQRDTKLADPRFANGPGLISMTDGIAIVRKENCTQDQVARFRGRGREE